MQGTLNVSLNARYPSTLQLLIKVLDTKKFIGISSFLEKKQRNKQSDWAVIVSSVVLAENYQEIPRFIAFWRKHFER